MWKHKAFSYRWTMEAAPSGIDSTEPDSNCVYWFVFPYVCSCFFWGGGVLAGGHINVFASEIHYFRQINCTVTETPQVFQLQLLSLCCPADLNGCSNYWLFCHFVLIIAVECTFVVFFLFNGKSHPSAGPTPTPEIKIETGPFIKCLFCYLIYLSPYFLWHAQQPFFSPISVVVTLALTRLQMKAPQAQAFRPSHIHKSSREKTVLLCSMTGILCSLSLPDSL